MSATAFNFICPLCQGDNACGNELAKQATTQSSDSYEQSTACWCQDASLRFPAQLLAQVPAHLKGKACICQTCVKNFLNAQCINRP